MYLSTSAASVVECLSAILRHAAFSFELALRTLDRLRFDLRMTRRRAAELSNWNALPLDLKFRCPARKSCEPGGEPARMDLKAAQYLTAIAECRSFTLAASRLGVAQSWLSTRIHRLESECGFLVFRRSSRALELTREGEAILVMAKRLLKCWQDVTQEIAALKHQARLKIGVSIDVPVAERMKLVDALMKLAKFEFEIHPHDDRTSMGLLEADQLDVVLYVGSSKSHYQHHDVGTALIHSDSIELQLPEGHSLARSELIEQKDLPGLEIVLAHPDTYARGASESLLQILKDRGARLLVSPDPDVTVIEQYAKSLGVATLSSRSRPPAVTGCVRRPLADIPNSEFRVAWKKNDPRDLVQKFRRVVMKLWAKG